MPQFPEDINLFFLQSFLYLELSLSRKNPVVHFEFATESVRCITKLSSNEIRETSCEGLKCMCTMFEINVQQDLKTCHFLASFNILSFIFGFGNFVLFSSRLERKQFNRKTFKITMSTYFVL